MIESAFETWRPPQANAFDLVFAATALVAIRHFDWEVVDDADDHLRLLDIFRTASP